MAKRLVSILLIVIICLSVTALGATAAQTAASAGMSGGAPIFDRNEMPVAPSGDEDLCTVYIYLNVTDTEYTAGAEVPRGSVYGSPALPDREDAEFFGWYTDRALTEPYDPEAPITEDTCLFPRWVKNEDICTVWIYLDASYDEPTAGVSVPRGDVYGAPEGPGREGEVFFGWYTDRALTEPYDPTAPITEDTCLFPRFEKESAVYLLGDVDCDGNVTVIDVTVLQRHIANMNTNAFLENAADADGDKDITVLDVTMIQRWLAGLPSNDRIGKLFLR